jgi:hypothetical protein
MIQDDASYSFSDVQQSMMVAADELVSRLTFCMAVDRDPGLRRRLRALSSPIAKTQKLFVRPPDARVWLVIGHDGPMKVVRDLPLGAHRLDANDLIEGRDDFWRELVVASERCKARTTALELLEPVFDPGIPLTGSRIAEITRWAPAIEVVAYQYFTNAGILLDNMRRPLLADSFSSAERDSQLIGYWRVLHTMGHLLTVASSSIGARPWLAEMATSFEWRTWSPTFTLSRERTLWLMAAAVKSAVACGETVVERYLTKLSASDHPVKSFDALVGLVAIGLDQPNSSGHILTELLAAGTHALRSEAGVAYVELMLNAAIETLRDPKASEQRYTELVYDNGKRSSNRANLLGPDALRRDPAEILPTGDILGIIALPLIVRSKPSEYYPRNGTEGYMIRPCEILQILKRAWIPDVRFPASRTLH